MPILKPFRGIQLSKSGPFARGLISCWPFNEFGGDLVVDLVNRLTCTFHNSPAWAEGNYGGCIYFNDGGDYSQYGSVPANSLFDFETDSFSIVWAVKYPLVKVSGHPYSGIILDANWNSSASNPNCWAIVTGSSSQPAAVRYYDVGDETGSFANNALLENGISDGWHVFVFVRDTKNQRFKLYRDGREVYNNSFTNLSSLTSSGLRIATSEGEGRYTGGKFSNVVIYGRSLTDVEASLLCREPFCMFEQETRQTFLFVPTINLAGTSGAQSSAAAAAKLTRRIKGLSAAATDVTAMMKIVGEALLSGSADASSVSSGKLMLSYRGPWLSKILKIERQWLTDALFNGITANAFKLGTVMSCGWFWMRPNGCTVLYRGTAMEKIDFTNILSVSEQNAESMSLPDYVPQNNSSTYFYVVRRLNNCGYQELTLYAAVKVAIDAEGNLAEPLPNHIFAWRAGQMDGNKVQLVWFYSPLEQKSKPECFKVYYDGGTGRIDYENPIATINYRGRKFYSYQGDVLAVGKYLFAIRAEDASGIQNSSSAQLSIQLDDTSPDAINILNVETI